MPKKPKIKLVIFDLGGVITSGGYLSFIHHYCLKCMTPEGQKKILQLEREVNLGKLTERQFYVQIKKTFGVHMKPEQMHTQIVKGMKVNKSLQHFIPKLKPAKLVLFSNSIGNMAMEVLKMRHFPVHKLLNKVFMSNKIHLAKPDAKAYEYVLKKMKIPAHEALMVDDRKENIDGVKKLGMYGIVFKNTAQFSKEIKKYELV